MLQVDQLHATHVQELTAERDKAEAAKRNLQVGRHSSLLCFRAPWLPMDVVPTSAARTTHGTAWAQNTRPVPPYTLMPLQRALAEAQEATGRQGREAAAAAGARLQEVEVRHRAELLAAQQVGAWGCGDEKLVEWGGG
jgi:hypothetical protein